MGISFTAWGQLEASGVISKIQIQRGWEIQKVKYFITQMSGKIVLCKLKSMHSSHTLYYISLASIWPEVTFRWTQTWPYICWLSLLITIWRQSHCPFGTWFLSLKFSLKKMVEVTSPHVIFVHVSLVCDTWDYYNILNEKGIQYMWIFRVKF